MRIQVQTSFTTVLSEIVTSFSEDRLFEIIFEAMHEDRNLQFRSDDGSVVIVGKQLLVNSVVTIIKD